VIPKPSKAGRKPKYNFSSLQIGECLNITETDKLKATQAAYAYAKRYGIKLVQRAGGREIWREL